MLPNGKTRLMGLIGQSISYTLSPTIHNTALKCFDINAIYLPLPMSKKNLSCFLKTAWDMGAMGLNVTKPHKESVAALFPGCGLTSVNTLYRGSHWWIPASTDGEGFIRGFERLGRSIQTIKNLIILGGGGASQAIVRHIVEMHKKNPTTICQQITVLCRRPQIAHDWVSMLDFPINIERLNPEKLKEILSAETSHHVIVQATSAPHQGDMMEEYINVLDGYRGVFVDLIYDKPTKIYYAALSRDILAQDGESMLIEQARLSQELWWGKSLPYDMIREALRNEKSNRTSQE